MERSTSSKVPQAPKLPKTEAPKEAEAPKKVEALQQSAKNDNETRSFVPVKSMLNWEPDDDLKTSIREALRGA
jgi:hypothetical protein